MSVAFKCDKCGKCFDPAQKDIEFIRIDGFALKNDKSYKDGTAICQRGAQHLCPVCTNEFLDWFDVGKEILETRIASYLKEREPIKPPIEKFRFKTGGDILSGKDIDWYLDKMAKYFDHMLNKKEDK